MEGALCLGRDFFGRFLKEKATEAGIDISGLQTVPDSTTLVFVSIDDAENREFAFVREPGADTRISRNALNTQFLENTAYLHFGTLSLTDDPARDATAMQQYLPWSMQNGTGHGFRSTPIIGRRCGKAWTMRKHGCSGALSTRIL